MNRTALLRNFAVVCHSPFIGEQIIKRSSMQCYDPASYSVLQLNAAEEL
jgi:hypothetical protein